MPDIFENFKDALSTGEKPQQGQEPQQWQSTSEQIAHNEVLQGGGQQQGNLPNSANNPERKQQEENAVMSDHLVGPEKGSKSLEASPDSWSPEYTARGFIEEAGNSLARGVGKHFLEGTGDMIQVLGAWAPGATIAKGNVLSRYLQKEGQEMAEEYKAYIPEELMHENLDFKSMADPKFWSLHVAEMIPQLVEFVALSKGGAAVAKRAAQGAAKQALKKEGVKQAATKIASGKEVFGTGSGITGKMLTTEGLSGTGKLLAGALGGGITGNQMSGALNAAQVVNQYKDVKGPDGQPLYSEEDLAELATSTWVNNSAWLAFDMASYGMTFGGGWKAAKGLNPFKRGLTSVGANSGKKVAKKAAYEMAPAIKGLAKLTGKAGFEGTEEMFQETFEEWAKQKAVDEMEGNPSSHLLNVGSYWDFMTSKENRGTLALSAAVGALGGAAFNVKTLVNQKADENYKLYNRIENFKQITKKNGTENELSFQEMHIRKTIADIVADENTDESVLNEFLDGLVENENISEEERNNYSELFEHFETVKEEGTKLNVKGIQALLENAAMETYAGAQIAGFQEQSQAKIDKFKSILSDENSTKQEQQDALNAIEKEEGLFEKRVMALSDLKVKAQRNQKSLILGKKANRTEVEIELDEFGNEIVVGLSEDQFNEFTKEGGGKKKKGGFSLSRFRGKTKEVIDKMAAPFLKKKEGEEEAESPKVEDRPKSNNQAKEEYAQAVDEASQLDEDEIAQIEQDHLVEATYNEKKGTYDVKSIDESGDEKAAHKAIEDRMNEKAEAYRKENPEPKSDAELEAKRLNDEAVVKGEEVVSDEEYNKFKDNNIVSKKMIDDIARTIYEKGELTNRQEEIRGAARADVQQAIMQHILGTGNIDRSDRIGDEDVDDESADESQENMENESDNINEDEVSDEERGFMDNVANNSGGKGKNGKKTVSMDEKRSQDKEKAKERWDLNRENTKNSTEAIGLDSREDEKKAAKKAMQQNLSDLLVEKQFLSKIRKHRLYGTENVSQNELDNYLNSFTMYNEHGPTALDKMVVVNHSLKRMFPNLEDDPVQVIMVQNMHKVLGTEALGNLAGSTIFIDERMWEQDHVFMHEMSHVFYRLAKNTPEVEAIMKMALADKDLIAEIKKKYPDYVQYDYSETINGELHVARLSQREIASHIRNKMGSDIDVDQVMDEMIRDGVLKSVPLKEQEYLLNEMFARVLQGPLSRTMDKTFAPKEQKRQRDVKKFWGMLRKRGEVIEQDGSLREMLSKLDDEYAANPNRNLKDIIIDTFKAATKGIALDGLSLDLREDSMDRERMAELEELRKEMSQRTNDPIDHTSNTDPNMTDDEFVGDYDDSIDHNNVTYDKDFRKQVRGATKILKRYGALYNKALRKRYLKNNKNNSEVDWRKIRTFDMPMFESAMYNLARENSSNVEFVYQVKNSEIKEIQDFYDYLNRVYPDHKHQVLASMHFVFSNSKHVGGLRTTIDNKGRHETVNSLAQRELNNADKILGSLDQKKRTKGDREWEEFVAAVERIKSGQETKEDYFTVIHELTEPDFHMDKVLEQGYITFKGRTIPIETLISGFIKKGLLNEYDTKTKMRREGQYSAWNARPLVEALIVTDRKFRHHSTIMNAEGNQEQVKVTNNHLMNELDNIIEYLGDLKEDTSLTQEEKLNKFLDRYSHIGKHKRRKMSKQPLRKKGLSEIYDFISPNGDKRIPSKQALHKAFPDISEDTLNDIHNKLKEGRKGKRMSREAFVKEYHGKVRQMIDNDFYQPNQFLKGIFDNYQSGIVPTLSQYHGLQNIENRKGSLYKNSTALEQGIEDFMLYVGSAVKKNGKKNKQYLGNVGTFSDSPRKFLMNMDRIDFSEVLQRPTGKSNLRFKFKSKERADRKVMNGFYTIAKEVFDGHPSVKNDRAFLEGTLKAIDDEIDFMNENANELSRINRLAPYFTGADGDLKLNKAGEELVAEYVLNSSIQGMNIAEVFLPGVKGKNISKRMKANSSPIFSVKNKDFKIETVFVSDEIVDGSEAGTDSGMYILKEDAEKFQRLGRGVMDMNNGFKFLNQHVEKNNPNFKDKSAYLKGYTTIVGEDHWAYPILKARKEKYNKWHKDKYASDPSQDLNDGTPNHVAIIVPQSSDKSGFMPSPFYDGDMNLTEEGERMTPSALRESWEHVNEMQDKLYYDENGDFMGLESYNFGPQQVMDKITKRSNTPVQLINSILVNAASTGNLQTAIEIQQHISNQKMKELGRIIKDLQSGDIAKYREIIDKGLNKDDMDQVQRAMLEDGGSIAHPKINEIAVNQLAKTILRAGNKLATDGTLAHQKPDAGYNLSNIKTKSVKTLQGYRKNPLTGSLEPAHIVLPKHMEGSVAPRTRIDMESHRAELANIQRSYKKEFTKDEVLERLESMAIKKAMKRFGVGEAEAQKYIGKQENGQGVHIGYYVKGETIIASRVPGHGPSSTGVYEVVDFDNSTDGNQVMVSGEMNQIMGSDNDGDALFIQTKGSQKEYAEWNKAFDKLTNHWLSKEMADQVTAKMNFEEDAKQILKRVKESFPQADENHLPFSPSFRRRDYNNTMVAKRNIGKIFNLHKAANMLATYEIQMNKGITIGGTTYNGFKDTVTGDNSRNQQSAILANIILDNAKHNLADGFGFDEHNMAQATLLVNMGVSLENAALILNSPAAKAWSEVQRNNESMYHESTTKANVVAKVYQKLGIKPSPKSKRKGFNVDPTMTGRHLDGPQAGQIKSREQQRNIIELLEYLGDMNDELQKVTGVMSGHNKIHVNPFVLEQQLEDFHKTVGNRNDNQILEFTEDFITNPDLQQYVTVARETLKHIKKLSPIYRKSTKKVLDSLATKVGGELSATQIEAISRDLMKFTTSRLLAHNNNPKAYVSGLLDQNSDSSIYQKLRTYFREMQEAGADGQNVINNSLLFSRALNYNLHGTNQYISANMSFTSESFTQEERQRVQEEFAELPQSLKDDLIIYDLVQNGWSGAQTISPFFDRDTNEWINTFADADHNSKNESESIANDVLRKLERTIALKHSQMRSNPMKKIYMRERTDKANDYGKVVRELLNNEDGFLDSVIRDRNPRYINVVSKNGLYRELYLLPKLTAEETQMMEEARGNEERRGILKNLIRNGKLEHIKNDLSYVTRKNSKGRTYVKYTPEIDIALIGDKTLGDPLKPGRGDDMNKSLKVMKSATASYEEMLKTLGSSAGGSNGITSLDAREDFDIPLFTKDEPLTQEQYEKAMEFKPVTSRGARAKLYEDYLKAKTKANKEKDGALKDLDKRNEEELLEMYTDYGNRDVYAYSNILTPIVKELAHRKAAEQAKLWKDNKGVKGKGFDGKDVSKIQAYMMTGSTIPSNHPASQAMVRTMEKEYKKFMGEKRRYVSRMNEITDRLYKEKLGYGKGRYRNLFRRVRDMFTLGKGEIYQRLYGNLVIRDENVDPKTGKITHDFRLRPQSEIEADYNAGVISQAEKDFYDYFKKTTRELMPQKVAGRNKKEDYIPHTAMSRMEALSARGLLGLMVNSKVDDDAVYDVKMYHQIEGKKQLVSFKEIEDIFKGDSYSKDNRNNIHKMREYRKLKKKALKLLKDGKNEDGSEIKYSNVEVETALGFGAMSRFTNNRSLKAEELPSMDLNKALGDYIHSTLFVNGNENFKGMEKLQGYIDGVLAFNRENGLDNMNTHVQSVWKDYFLRGRRQTSFMGEKADKVIRTLTGLNLFYSLGYVANKNTGGMYVLGNIMVGKYHNIKDIGGKKWLEGEMKYWGLDKGLEGGVEGVLKRHRRMNNIMKNLNFMEVNVYDEVEMEKKNGLDSIFTDLALMPMTKSENWIQRVHMLGMLDEDILDRFDEEGNYKQGETEVSKDMLIALEDRVKSQHGRGYQPTDQRAVQMYSWGNMMLQFSKFIPTMIQDRFAKKDVNIYGQEHIGSLRAVSDMVRHVANDPKKFVEYRKKLSPEQRARLDSGLKGMAMSAVIGFAGTAFNSETAQELYGDANYYFNHGKLEGKLVPPAIQSTNNLIAQVF